MPRPATSRLDLLLVPSGDRVPAEATLQALEAALADQGVLGEGHEAGPRAHRLVQGGFRRLGHDRPPSVVLYANRTGGFHVRCPQDGANLAAAFQQALTAFRRGGPRVFTCPVCGREHALDALDFAPPAALGRFALVLSDAGAPSLTEEGGALIRRYLGDVRVVARRA